MHCFQSVFIAVLNLIFVHARPQDLYSFNSLDPSLDEADSYDLFSGSPGFDDLSSDYNFDFLNQDSTTASWDLASLPNCDTQSSLTDDFLQARDNGASCSSQEPQGNPNLPTDLYQDPLQFLDNGLKTPPAGQDAQPDLGSKDGNLNFNSFINSRPKSVIDYSEDESICPSRRYGLSTTPVCHYPDRGSSPVNGQGAVSTLYDVSPCRFYFFGLSTCCEVGPHR